MTTKLSFWAKEILSTLFSLITLPTGIILHCFYNFPKNYRCIYWSKHFQISLFRGCGKWFLPMIDMCMW